MSGNPVFTPIPASPAQPANASTFNPVYTKINQNLADHENGVAGTRHLLAEIDSALLDNVASAPVLSTAATDLNTRMLQFAESLAKLATGANAVTWAAAINGLNANANLTNIGNLLGNSTTPAGARAGLGAAASGANTDITSLGTLSSLKVDPGVSALAAVTASSVAVSSAVSIGATLNVTGVLTASGGVVGNLTGNASGSAGSVAASGITGTIAGTQIDATIARTANVPTNAGAGATGSWPISVTGTATNVTGTVAAANIDAAIARVANVPTNAGGGATGTWPIAVTGAAGSVAAGSIIGTITASQIDPAIARAANVPTNTGGGATGTWPIGISGNAATATTATSATSATSAGTVPASGVTGIHTVAQGGTGVGTLAQGGLLTGAGASPVTALIGTVNGQVPVWSGTAWAAGSVVVPDYSVTTKKLGDGAVTPDSPPSLRVSVNALKKFDGAGNAVQWSGGYLDLTAYVPGTGTSVWVMVYLNATAAVYASAGAASATPMKPQAIGGQTPLAYVLMYAGQITVQAADIYEWRTDFAAFAVGGGTGSGYSAVGHLHGQGGESFVAVSATDEGRPTTPNVAALTVYVQPTRYSDTNSVVQQFPGGLSATIAKPVSYPYYVAVGLSQSGTVTLNYGAENATPVRGQFLNTTDIPLSYVLVRTGSTRTILNDDSVNALIIDARRPYTFSSPAAGGITPVSSGGTGQSAFPAGTGLLFTTGSTGVFQMAPATIGTPTVGFGLNPTITPAGANADLFQGGGGVVNTGSTNTGTITGLHIMASTKTGTGTIPVFNALTIEAQTIGTTNNSLNVVGNAVVSGNMTVGGGLTFNSNLVITAATAVVAQFNSNAAAGIVAVVNGAAAATGLLTSWRVNGVEQANMGPGGVLTAKGVINSGNETIAGTLGTAGITIAPSAGPPNNNINFFIDNRNPVLVPQQVNATWNGAGVAGQPIMRAYGQYAITSGVNPTDVAMAGVDSWLNVGGAGIAPLGSVIAVQGRVFVHSNGNTSNEHSAYFGILEYDAGVTATPGNAWFTDYNLYGPIGVQPSKLGGITLNMQNRFAGSPWLSGGNAPFVADNTGTSINPATGMALITGQSIGPGATASTPGFPNDIGYWVGGSSGNDYSGIGWKYGLLIGGRASNWGATQVSWAQETSGFGYSRFLYGAMVMDWQQGGMYVRSRLQGGGSGAVGTATITGGTVASIAVTAGGAGYSSVTVPKVTILGDGSGATAHAVVTAGVITSFVVDTPGANYTGATVLIAGAAPIYAPAIATHQDAGPSVFGGTIDTLYQPPRAYSYLQVGTYYVGTVLSRADATNPTISGSLQSPWLSVNGNVLPTPAGSAVSVASFGAYAAGAGGNMLSLGVSANRIAATATWQNASLALRPGVDTSGTLHPALVWGYNVANNTGGMAIIPPGTATGASTSYPRNVGATTATLDVQGATMVGAIGTVGLGALRNLIRFAGTTTGLTAAINTNTVSSVTVTLAGATFAIGDEVIVQPTSDPPNYIFFRGRIASAGAVATIDIFNVGGAIAYAAGTTFAVNVEVKQY